jgi:hypothetical protein
MDMTQVVQQVQGPKFKLQHRKKKMKKDNDYHWPTLWDICFNKDEFKNLLY